jgi:hypothetical protein
MQDRIDIRRGLTKAPRSTGHCGNHGGIVSFARAPARCEAGRMDGSHVARALQVLEQRGLLLLQDMRLPNLVGLIAGEAVQGSWWGHPQGSAIYRAGEKLGEHRDVTTAKLISTKVTFIHSRLWPQLIAIGRAREPWQMRGLGDEALALLTRVQAEDAVRASGKTAKQLELRLLVASQGVHTESGRHALDLLSWDVFARKRALGVSAVSAAEAQADLEAVVNAMNVEFAAHGTLPWRSHR